MEKEGAEIFSTLPFSLKSQGVTLGPAIERTALASRKQFLLGPEAMALSYI
jgi:hypothetical protein